MLLALSLDFFTTYILFWPCLGCLTGTSRSPFVCCLIFIIFMLLQPSPLHTHMSAKIVYASLFLLNFVDFFFRSLARLPCHFSFCLRSALLFFPHICAHPPKVLPMQSINLNKLKTATRKKKNKYEIASLWVLNAGFKELKSVAQCTNAKQKQKKNVCVYILKMIKAQKRLNKDFYRLNGSKFPIPIHICMHGASLVLSLPSNQIFCLKKLPFRPT